MAISIDQPPVNDPMIDKNGYLTGVWRDWFTTNIGTLITILSAFGIQLPPITTPERDTIQNTPDFLLIGNSTTGEPQIYLSGAWKNITHS